MYCRCGTEVHPVGCQQNGNGVYHEKAKPAQHAWAGVVAHRLHVLPRDDHAARALPQPALAHHTALPPLGRVAHVGTARLDLVEQPRKRVVHIVVRRCAIQAAPQRKRDLGGERGRPPPGAPRPAALPRRAVRASGRQTFQAEKDGRPSSPSATPPRGGPTEELCAVPPSFADSAAAAVMKCTVRNCKSGPESHQRTRKNENAARKGRARSVRARLCRCRPELCCVEDSLRGGGAVAQPRLRWPFRLCRGGEAAGRSRSLCQPP